MNISDWIGLYWMLLIDYIFDIIYTFVCACVLLWPSLEQFNYYCDYLWLFVIFVWLFVVILIVFFRLFLVHAIIKIAITIDFFKESISKQDKFGLHSFIPMDKPIGCMHGHAHRLHVQPGRREVFASKLYPRECLHHIPSGRDKTCRCSKMANNHK